MQKDLQDLIGRLTARKQQKESQLRVVEHMLADPSVTDKGTLPDQKVTLEREIKELETEIANISKFLP